MVPTEAVQIDSRILFILMLSDAVVGTQGLCGLVANPRLKALEEPSTARQTRAKLLSFRGMLLGGVSDDDGEGRRLGESDGGGLRVRGRRAGGDVLLQQLLVEPMIFAEKMLVLVGGLRARHFILLQAEDWRAIANPHVPSISDHLIALDYGWFVGERISD